jgi:nucleoid DNA-binding protein
LHTQKNDYNIINKERKWRADIVAKISEKLEKDVQATVETLWMKLKFIRNWRQCLFKRFRKFYCKTRAEKKEIFPKYNNKMHTTPAFKPAKFCWRSKDK